MEPGTSDLQHEILRRAMTGRDARLRRGPVALEPKADVDTGELLADLFGFGKMRSDEHGTLPDYVQHDHEEGGRDEYDIEGASLSRAIARLWRRGLVTIYRASPSEWTGIGLTDAGIEAAREPGPRRQSSSQ
jgi:hypothetical protein